MKPANPTKDIWLTVARAYRTPPARRTPEQTHITETGLCRAIAKLEYTDYATYHTAYKQLHNHLGNLSTYLLPVASINTYHHKGHLRKHDLLRARIASTIARQA